MVYRASIMTRVQLIRAHLRPDATARVSNPSSLTTRQEMEIREALEAYN